MYYYEIAPTAIIRQNSATFTYHSTQKLSIGVILKIPVGQKTYIGVIIKKVKKPSYKTKEIGEIIYDQPLPKPLIKTALWVADYYKTHLALVTKMILPTGVATKRRQKTIKPNQPTTHSAKIKPNKNQQQAIQNITNSQNQTLILHGVTGAGKTLVYIELAKKVIQNGQSAIIIIPEIALTTQLLLNFTQYFDDVLVAHSRQTEAERHLIWQQALLSNKPYIAIGARSALFLPLANVGLIVIDECHEPTLKQEQSPRYSALRTASVLAKYHHGKAVFGSATPSVEDYYLAGQKNDAIISLPTSARHDAKPPKIQVIDMTSRQNITRHPFLSIQLIDALKETFQQKKQALIYHNRRGTTTTTMCQQCGWVAACHRCFIPLTLHADIHKMRCHMCGEISKVMTSCPTCKNTDIIHKGIGTKKIEVELSKIFPKINIARFDGDNSKDNTVEKQYQALHDGEINLIIGTQVIAKGLDLPNLTTVGIIQADAGINMPDFAATERTFQLLAQVVGRVGRSKTATQVIVQSYQPNHPIIKSGITQNYQQFYQETIENRRRMNFPPFCFLLKLTCTYKTEKSAFNNARKVADILQQQASQNIQIFGPTPAFYERIRDTYRWQIVVKSKQRQTLVDLLQFIPAQHWQAELDPTSLL